LRKYFYLILLVAIFLLAGCNREVIETNMSKKVADFSFTTESNESLALDDLKGKYWIADFIFTNCTTVCLPMSANMKYLQDTTIDKGYDIQFVSFSVDPDYDSPDILTEYAADYEADLNSWTFLTGYDFDTIRELSIKSFQSPVYAPVDGDDQVMHGTNFFLVNPQGKVIKKYDGVQSSNMEIILDDLEQIFAAS